MKPIITNSGNLSFVVQKLDNQFKLTYDKNKLKVIINNKGMIKKDLRVLVRKDMTNELTYFSLNDDKNAFELEWKYFLDPRSTYSLFFTVFNDKAKIKKNVRFKEKYLSEFNEGSLITNNNLDIKIYKTKHDDIKLDSF